MKKEVIARAREQTTDIRMIWEMADSLLAEKKYDNIKEFLLSNKEIVQQDNDLSVLCYLCTIYEKEKAAGVPVIFTKVSDAYALLERYTRLKFYLRRIEFDVIDQEDMDNLCAFLVEKQISNYELLTVIDFCVFHKQRVLQVIKGEIKMETPELESIPDLGDQNCENTICFIICSNNKLYEEECLFYIHRLTIPSGYQIEILTVEDAASMTAGYNEAMRHSRAKYKVYLHQDTFLINHHFLQDILDIFHSDRKIGMIGVIGSPKVPENGVMWDSVRYGMIYEQHIYETVKLSNQCSKPLEEVEAVDGLLMVTQYDIPWREDLFDQWDYYDCSQSMEFIRRGYKVVVPGMEEPWCVHDCGFLNLNNFEKERKKYVQEYMEIRD